MWDLVTHVSAAWWGCLNSWNWLRTSLSVQPLRVWLFLLYSLAILGESNLSCRAWIPPCAPRASLLRGSSRSCKSSPGVTSGVPGCHFEHILTVKQVTKASTSAREYGSRLRLKARLKAGTQERKAVTRWLSASLPLTITVQPRAPIFRPSFMKNILAPSQGQ